jgi:hypothetical protein
MASITGETLPARRETTNTLPAVLPATTLGPFVEHEPPSRALVLSVADFIRNHMERTSWALRHDFAPGLYARTVMLPKGTLIEGAVHGTWHFMVVLTGDVEIMDENHVERIAAPAFFASPKGTKRIVYAVEDSILTTIHATDKTTVEDVEKDMKFDTYEAFEAHERIIEGQTV